MDGDDNADLVRYVDELRTWADAIEDATVAIDAVVTAMPGAWADPVGREWTERLHLVGVELARRAEEAQHLARDAELAAHAPDVGVPFGMRLGGQSGTRVTDRRGMVIPTLPQPP